METPAEITSIRIISVDHYQHAPVIGLDHCYSKFRGNDIKQVPVIRLFGSIQNGDKICLHVHSVLPYIYIPYDSTVPRSEHDRFVYQVIGSLEKALNVTMGLSKAQTQHIYDVQHVKGIPFYGYHPKEHQFLKIQFYNPYLTKKAASLLQNAAICGRVLQSFESHIPFILQFFMDYNLYGMSFIHVNTENIVYRVQEEQSNRLLGNGLIKTSRCVLEADIKGSHILNYLSYAQTNQVHQNPGIAFIWEDETKRRKALEIQDSVDLPITQDRPKAKPTESDLYFKALLTSKLENHWPSTSIKAKPRKSGKFNLPGLLGDAVYPAECPEGEDSDSILNASCLPHLMNSMTGNFSSLSFLNETQVDERIVHSLSQRDNAHLDDTFDEDDLSLLNILEELEENRDPIDDDSILAPLSQKSRITTASQLNRSQRIVLSQNLSVCGKEMSSDEGEDDEDEGLNALNLTLMDTQSEDFPQFDGGDDTNHKSAHKNEINFESRTTRSAKKKPRYAPLDIKVISSPKKKLQLLNQNEGAATPADNTKVTTTAPTPISRKSPRARKSVNYSPRQLGTDKKVEKEDLEATWKKEFNIKDCTIALSKVEDKVKEELPIALIYDLQNGITAEAGSSRCHKMKKPDLMVVAKPAKQNLDHDEEEEEDEEPGMKSFYDKTLCFNGSSQSEYSFSESLSLDVPTPTPPLSSLPITSNKNFEQEFIRITPKALPPDPDYVKFTFSSYGFFENVFEKPFYSDPKDVTKKREIGGVLLELKAKNYCEPFQSSLGSEFVFRKVNRQKNSSKRVRITPHCQPPSLKDAQEWLRARNKMKQKEAMPKESIDVESPVKMKRERTLLVIESSEELLNGDDVGTEESSGIIFKDDPNLSLDNSLHSIDINSSVIDTTPEAVVSIKKMRYSSNRKSSQKDMRKSCYRLSASKKLDLNETIPEDSSELGIKPLDESQDTKSSTEDDPSLLRDKKYLNLTENTFHRDDSQFSQPTLNNTYGFKMDLENLNDVKVNDEHNHLVILSLELHCKTRGKLLPDPEHDAIAAVFYAISNDSPPTESRPRNVNGVIIVQNEAQPANPSLYGVKVNGLMVESELQLFEKLIEIIHFWDPDILAGYEIELSSWGYLIARGHALTLNVPSMLSRVILKKYEEVREVPTEDFEDEFEKQLKIHGRIVLDVWRLMRHEINLMSYSFENIMYHIMHRRYPKHSHVDLTKWWTDSRTSWIVLQYYVQRSRGSLEILDQLDLIGRTCELAKLFGIQFFEVLSRGSQFRVESMMLRMAKPRNFIPISPSVQQRVHMRAPEYLPLILEPESRLYVDPVIVLDFQSLYPSMMIAYNYCFSTCLGRVDHLGDITPFEFGASQLQVSPRILRRLLEKDLLTVSPAGIAFVKPAVREGTLPRLLKEILDTRIMVKNSMKLHKDNKLLQRVLHSRQLGLKLIANVTYGYTAANYSGRMSCVEVADSILSKARETLERAIKLVESNNKWNVKVVYGDTDSMFVLVPGRSKEEAFAIGEEIAQLITEDNPNPVKLKLEKVYQPCILQTKKRYVGFMYETKDQREPVYEAKGIETVRRDGCPIVARMLEKVLRILFETKDVSLIKQYVNREFTKIISGKVNIQDLTFGREFRGLSGYKPNVCVPALQLTRKWKQLDKRNEPRSGERVPYVIANGPPGLPLIKLVRSPDELLADEGLKINCNYYILKAIIPPLNRCLLLIGVDVNNWFTELRQNNLLKFEQVLLTKDVMNDNNNYNSNNLKKRSTISQYFSNTDCIIDCGRQTKKVICDQCKQQPQKVAFVLQSKMQSIERKFRQVELICQSCCGRQFETACTSLDCPILFSRTKRERKFQQLDLLGKAVDLM